MFWLFVNGHLNSCKVLVVVFLVVVFLVVWMGRLIKELRVPDLFMERKRNRVENWLFLWMGIFKVKERIMN